MKIANNKNASDILISPKITQTGRKTTEKVKNITPTKNL